MNGEPLDTAPAMECGKCGHQYPDPQGGWNIYTCPACGTGPPFTHTIYPFRDHLGNIIARATLHRLRKIGIAGVDKLIREEVLELLPIQIPSHIVPP